MWDAGDMATCYPSGRPQLDACGQHPCPYFLPQLPEKERLKTPPSGFCSWRCPAVKVAATPAQVSLSPPALWPAVSSGRGTVSRGLSCARRGAGTLVLVSVFHFHCSSLSLFRIWRFSPLRPCECSCVQTSARSQGGVLRPSAAPLTRRQARFLLQCPTEVPRTWGPGGGPFPTPGLGHCAISRACACSFPCRTLCPLRPFLLETQDTPWMAALWDPEDPRAVTTPQPRGPSPDPHSSI